MKFFVLKDMWMSELALRRVRGTRFPGIYRVILGYKGLYGDNGKENGSYCLGFRGCIQHEAVIRNPCAVQGVVLGSKQIKAS